MKQPLPENVNILTLETRIDGKILIRLEHLYDQGEDDVLSQPETIILDVNQLLQPR